MITEKRLKELVKERKDFFEASIYDDIPRKINIKEIDISKPFVFYDDENGKAKRVFYNLLSGQLCSVDLERIFETEEEAQEYLEFDTIQKTETLLMCDWNVAKDKKCGYCADFWVDGSNYSMLISGNTIYIQEEYYSNEKWNKDILFKESLNRENYDKARRLCRKLFLGEEI